MRTRSLCLWAALGLLWAVTGAGAQPKVATRAQSVAALKKQAASGDPKAQFALGLNYDNGDGVQQDAPLAARWFRKAAEQKNPGGEYYLGVAYLFGSGVSLDQTLGVSWIRKAAEQGYPSAQTDLAGFYLDGKYVSQNYALAVSWYRKAADAGNPDGQFGLARLYKEGIGVPQSYSEAYFWMSLAAANPDLAGTYSFLSEKYAKFRDIFAKELTPADLSRLQERVRKWVEDHPTKPQ